MQSPPICSNEQWEQKQTAYRYWYALGFLLYHTTQKMSNDSFRCFRKNKNDLTNQQKSRTIKVKRAHQQTVCSHGYKIAALSWSLGAVISFCMLSMQELHERHYKKCL